MHSNVNDLTILNGDGDSKRAYIATDGGVYEALIALAPSWNIIMPTQQNKSLNIGAYNYINANSLDVIVAGTPSLAVQSIGDTANTNYSKSAVPIWSVGSETNQFITEGEGTDCVFSIINDDFYIYSLFRNQSLTVRRSETRGYTFHPIAGASSVEWFSKPMLTPAVTCKSPILMWESFNETFTPDTVWFKADITSNFIAGDKTIYASSKNYGYPIAFTTVDSIKNGDSIAVPDRVQNRTFFAAFEKLFMTREALRFDKTPPAWFQIAVLEKRDTASYFAISSDADHLFIGSRIGNLYRVSNIKHAYDSLTANITSSACIVKTNLIHKFEGRKVVSVAVNQKNPQHVIVVLNGEKDNVFETLNALDSVPAFNSIKDNLPDIVYTVIFSKEDETIIVGTERGIWTRVKGATTWVAENNGLNEVPVKVLFQVNTRRPGVKGVRYPNPDPTAANPVLIKDYPSNNRNYLAIYAGTYGSGIFVSKRYVGIEESPIDGKDTDSNTLVVIPNPVRDEVTIKTDLNNGEKATIQIYDVNGRCIKEQAVTSATQIISFKNYEPGIYIIRLINQGITKSAKIIKID
jgi:hypothetical protein